MKGRVLAHRLDDAQFEILQKEAQESLRPFVAADGTVALRAPAYLITEPKPEEATIEPAEASILFEPDTGYSSRSTVS